MIVINTSLIAWIFKNFDSVEYWKLYIVVGLIFMISSAIAMLFVKILKEIKKLEEL